MPEEAAEWVKIYGAYEKWCMWTSSTPVFRSMFQASHGGWENDATNGSPSYKICRYFNRVVHQIYISFDEMQTINSSFASNTTNWTKHSVYIDRTSGYATCDVYLWGLIDFISANWSSSNLLSGHFAWITKESGLIYFSSGLFMDWVSWGFFVPLFSWHFVGRNIYLSWHRRLCCV